MAQQANPQMTITPLCVPPLYSHIITLRQVQCQRAPLLNRHGATAAMTWQLHGEGGSNGCFSMRANWGRGYGHKWKFPRCIPP